MKTNKQYIVKTIAEIVMFSIGFEINRSVK